MISNAYAAFADLRVIDGDTIIVDGDKVRLEGIDAPEMKQTCLNSNRKNYKCGSQARNALKAMLLSNNLKSFKCNVSGKDRYDRLIGECFIDQVNINEWMVRQGWAMAYLQYSKKYVEQEKSARAEKIGIWQGDFIKPWDWRRGKRLSDNSGAAKNDCKIKGNISSSGEKIYHLPSGQYYERTKINSSKGELWFCSEDEARASGWRKSKR